MAGVRTQADLGECCGEWTGRGDGTPKALANPR